ncbi:MAG: PAS domain S-box protein, partial [Burkholderiaceae bacterium]
MELLDIGARSGIFAGWATICVTGFSWAQLRGSAETTPLTTWAVAMFVVSIARIATFTVWKRLRDGDRSVDVARDGIQRYDPARVKHWERLHEAAAFCCGLTWASLVLFAVGDVEKTTMLIGFTLAVGLVMAGSFYATDRIACALYASPIIVAQEFNLLRLPVDSHDLIAVAWLGFVVLLYFMPRISTFSLREGLIARVDHERRASEQTALLETAPLGILVIRDAIIVACNDALLALLGYDTKDELVGQNVRVVIADDDAWEEMTSDATAALRGRVPPRIVHRRRKDGSVIAVMRNVAAIRGDGRGADGEREFIGIYEDV